MSQEVRIPKLGLTMEDATVVEWHVQDGAMVTQGHTLLTIETDKIMFDIEAEGSGYLQQVVRPNQKVMVGDLAGYLHPTPDAIGRSEKAEASSVSTKAPSPAPASPHPAQARVGHPAALTVPGNTRLLASPLARQLAGQHQIDLLSLQGSGPGGVILKRDVMSATTRTTTAEPTRSPSMAPVERRPMNAMRRTISQRMMHSLQSTAQMTGFGKIDMGEAVAWREALVSDEKRLGVRITYTDLMLKVCACVLQELPEINAYIDGDDIVSLSDINLGFAVSVNGGLVVPVIHQVDRLSLVEVAHRRLGLIEKARAGKLGHADVSDGSFTLSNFGSYGGDFETPILNPPQSALLGMGRITDEAVVRNREIVIRPMMWMSFTFDHRLIDGELAGRFRSRVRTLLEQPLQLLANLR